jgi:MFS family permease
MDFINFDFLLKTVLPKLFTSSLASFFIALVLGSLIGWVATAIARKKSRSRPAPNLIMPTMFGTFVGMMLIGFLPIEANPSSLVGGPYSGLWYMLMFIVLAPLGILLGAGLGISLGTKLTAQRKHNRSKRLRSKGIP